MTETREVLLISAATLAVVAIASFVVVRLTTGPTFELERSAWTCTQSRDRRVPRIVGKSIVLTTETMCLEYRHRFAPPPDCSALPPAAASTETP